MINSYLEKISLGHKNSFINQHINRVGQCYMMVYIYVLFIYLFIFSFSFALYLNCSILLFYIQLNNYLKKISIPLLKQKYIISSIRF